MRTTVMAKLEEIMEKNNNVVVLTGDLGFSVLDKIQDRFPKQFFNVGISEQAMMGIAAGLAKQGKKVIVYSIIPFLIYRPYEQVMLDICYHKLPVILIGSAEGFSYGVEGVSHYALNDLSLTLQLPGMQVYAPAEPQEAASFLEEALETELPAYIRLTKSKGEKFKNRMKKQEGNGITFLREGDGGLILSTGGISFHAERAADQLAKEGISMSHLHIGRITPLDKNYLEPYIPTTGPIVSVEEHSKTLGFGKFICEYIRKKITILGVENIFERNVGEREYMLKNSGLDSEGIYNRIKELIKK